MQRPAWSETCNLLRATTEKRAFDNATWQSRSDRTMTSKSRDDGAFVMVGLEREDETVSKVMQILEPLGIPVEVVGRGRQLRRMPSVVLRVPHHRVAETLLALELQGFPDVLAYQNVDDLPGVSESERSQ